MHGIRERAAAIDHAHRERQLLDAAAQPPLDLPVTYAAQRELTALRAARGAHRIGVKLGYTSRAMREQMGIDEPNHGPLLDTMRITDGRIPGTLVQPRIEPEMPSSSAPTCDPRQPTPLSRWWTRSGRTIGSASSSTPPTDPPPTGALGPPLPLDTLATLPVRLVRNGAIVAEGTGAAAMAVHCTRWIGYGTPPGSDPDTLHHGDIVITGDPTAAIPVEPSDTVEAVFGDHAASVGLHDLIAELTREYRLRRRRMTISLAEILAREKPVILESKRDVPRMVPSV